MKTKRNLFLVSIISLSFLLVKCGKDGAVGPQGEKGDTGAQGVIGPAGPAGNNGKSGSLIYSGSTTPLATTGVVGDYYINTSTGFLYGPKTANGWGVGYSLKGPTGATGATGTAGTKTLSGAGAPLASLGSKGDFYLDKTNYSLYGPKTDSGWGAAISLRGPAGTANVIYSDWVTPATYTKDTIFNTYHFFYNITASKITQGILDDGAVIVYGKLNGYNPVIWPTNNVAAFPIIVNYKISQNGITYTDTWSAINTVGNVRIDFVNNMNYYSGIAAAHSFRYVIIPGGVHTTSAAHINFNNYQEVKKYFNFVN